MGPKSQPTRAYVLYLGQPIWACPHRTHMSPIFPAIKGVWVMFYIGLTNFPRKQCYLGYIQTSLYGGAQMGPIQSPHYSQLYVIQNPYKTHIEPIQDPHRPYVKLIWAADMGPTWIPFAKTIWAPYRQPIWGPYGQPIQGPHRRPVCFPGQGTSVQV